MSPGSFKLWIWSVLSFPLQILFGLVPEPSRPFTQLSFLLFLCIILLWWTVSACSPPLTWLLPRSWTLFLLYVVLLFLLFPFVNGTLPFPLSCSLLNYFQMCVLLPVPLCVPPLVPPPALSLETSLSHLAHFFPFVPETVGHSPVSSVSVKFFYTHFLSWQNGGFMLLTSCYCWVFPEHTDVLYSFKCFRLVTAFYSFHCNYNLKMSIVSALIGASNAQVLNDFKNLISTLHQHKQSDWEQKLKEDIWFCFHAWFHALYFGDCVSHCCKGSLWAACLDLLSSSTGHLFCTDCVGVAGGVTLTYSRPSGVLCTLHMTVHPVH